MPNNNNSDFSFDEKIGDDLDYDLTLTYGGVPLTPSQITEIYFSGKRSENIADPGTFQVKFTTGDISTVSGPAGTYHIHVSGATVAAALTGPVTLLADLKVKLVANNLVKTLLDGKLHMYLSITKAPNA